MHVTSGTLGQQRKRGGNCKVGTPSGSAGGCFLTAPYFTEKTETKSSAESEAGGRGISRFEPREQEGMVPAGSITGLLGIPHTARYKFLVLKLESCLTYIVF